MRIVSVSCLALLLAACSNGDPIQPAAGADSSTAQPASAEQTPVTNRDSEAASEAEGTPLDNTPLASGSPAATPENSQTGSPGAAQCFVDADCQRDVGDLSVPAANVQLVGAGCQFLNYQEQPACECQLRRAPSPGQDSYIFSAWPGNRPGGCSEYARAPGCLYCGSEFPGCNIDEPGSCDAVCADFVARKNQDQARTIPVRERLARCTEYHCEWLYEIDGKCYVGEPGRPEARGYDCSLSDDELLAKPELATESSCGARPPLSCASAKDCPGGLACKDGVCAPCEQTCFAGSSSDEASCTGGGVCASGETCAASVCVPDVAVTCRDYADCGQGQACVASGVDWSAGRGNEHSRTFCGAAR